MRIAYCITRSDTLGGAHVHVGDMAAWVRLRGHEAAVIVGGEGPYCDHLSRKGVPYFVCQDLQREVDLRSDVRATFQIRRTLKNYNPDLISLHSAKAGLLGRLAAVRLGAPVIFTAHGWSFNEGVPRRSAFVYRLTERLCAPLAERIITVSEYDRLMALRSGIGRSERMVAIHNAMPDSEAMADPGESAGLVRIVMVARLEEPKDHATLFKALAGLPHQQWSLDLVGDGPLEGVVRAEADRLNITDRVRFLGLRHDVDSLLAQAHVFVLTTNWEGFPRSILEAMRAGLPVVATSVNGIPESVNDGVNGFLVPRRGVSSLREKLGLLIRDASLRETLGLAGRQLFEEKFRFERMAEQTWEVYEEVLGMHQ